MPCPLFAFYAEARMKIFCERSANFFPEKNEKPLSLFRKVWYNRKEVLSGTGKRWEYPLL